MQVHPMFCQPPLDGIVRSRIGAPRQCGRDRLAVHIVAQLQCGYRGAGGGLSRLLLLVVLVLGLANARLAAAAPAEIVLDFESATIGKPVTSWKEKDVVFTLAHEPRESKAPGRVMFFPHIETQRRGILCAMATEPIPVRATFPHPVSAVTLVLWGSTGCAARLEAFDAAGNVVATSSLPAVPQRKAPGDPVPFCELRVDAPAIAYIEFSGQRAGEFLAADELRYTVATP